MLNSAELAILDACANHYEVFYYPFAEVNYGGQVVSVDPGDPARSSFPQIEDEGPWEITVPGEEVARYMSRLIESGMLQCWRLSDDPTGEIPASYGERLEITRPDEREFAVYTGYDCLTWDEHMERFGDGPHDFRTTQAGIKEINRPIYDELYGERRYD